MSEIQNISVNMLHYFALLLPCSVCLFWAVLLYIKRKSNSRSQNILAFCVLLSGFSFFVIANYLAGITDYGVFYKLDMADAFVSLLIFPLMYLYFKSLTHHSPFGWKDYMSFVPAFLIGGSTLFLYRVMGEENAQEYIRSFLTGRTPVPLYQTLPYKLHFFISVQLYDMVLLVQGVGVAVYAVVSLIRYHRRLSDFYSDLDGKSINQNYAVLMWFMLSLLFILLFMLQGGRPRFEQMPLFTALFFVGWAAVYFGLCYHGSHIGYTVEMLQQELERADREAADDHYDWSDEEGEAGENGNPADDKRKYTKYLALFEKLIAEDKIFLQSNLRMDEVARIMHTNRTYISRMIKEEFQCSFSDYINKKRIECAKELMSSVSDMKQDELSEKSGFSNAPSFSRIFKQIEGVPPKEWQRNNICSGKSDI